MSGRDERPVKREIPIIEPFSIMDWLAEHEPRLMRIDRNEIRRVRREAARNAILINLVVLAFGLFTLIWGLVILNPIIAIIGPACIFLAMAIKEDVETYNENTEINIGEIQFVRRRRKTN